MPSRRAGKPVLLEELTSAEFAKLARRKPVAVLPFGSVEEHGPHLPLCTDAYQAEEIARRVASELGGLLCPPIRYGECRTTRNFPGTVTLTSETVKALAFEIVSELGRNGIDKVLVISGHAGSGHMAALRLGALRAVERTPGLKVMVLSDYDIAYDLRGKEFPTEDGHGGEIETSRILNTRPDLVGRLRPKGTGRPPEYMLLPDPERYMPTGIYGDTTRASAAKGGRIDDHVVERLCALVRKNFKMKGGK